MIARHTREDLQVLCPAKVNLHLEVLRKRGDGFHELETLMASVDLFDSLTLRNAPSGTTLTCSDTSLEGSTNLVRKAVDLIRRETGVSTGLYIHLAKRIPQQSGLAGGSSDAAGALVALDRWWELRLPKDRLIAYAAELGSDVPFFLDGPAAVCRGRGERVEPIPAPAPIHLVLVKPDFGLSTAAVFAALDLDGDRKAVEPMVDAFRSGDVERVAKLLFNRLETPAQMLNPQASAVRRRLEDLGALGASMTGSGSAVFALCTDAQHARDLADAVRKENLGAVYVVQTGR